MSCTIDSSLAVADIASLVLKRGCTVLPTQQHYTGILLLEAAVHRAECDPALREEARALLLPFARGERDFGSNFPNYQCGGNAAARALAAGWLDEARDAVTHYADAYLNDFPRDDEGLMMMPRHDRPKIWIDAAWAVAPFACFAGVALERPELIDDAVHQIMRMMEIFDDPSCDLIHQSRGFVGPNELSSDHWSRGNGWAAIALAELAIGLPAEHPRRSEVEAALVRLLGGCLRCQDALGMWHQEMADPEAWVETSGTGLILFALGVAIERGLMPGTEARAALELGLRGMLRYIAFNGSVHHTCMGCLSPGKGTPAEYLAKRHAVDDPHSFGPPVLAFTQAAQCGITHISVE